MFSAKNFSPRQLSALTALIISIPVSVGIGLMEKSWGATIISFVIVFTGAYLLVDFIFQQFIYRKIKLIYKIIYRTKASKKEEMYYKYILPQKSIDEVREDVEAWAVQQKREIEILKKNEIFRREFLQNLSHEFKTPVFAIQGYIDTLLQGAMENPDVNRRFLEKASRNVERLVNLIQDLDEISRLERGELKLNKRNFVIQDVIREAYENLYLKAEQQHITFSFKKGCEQPRVVYADKDKILQVLVNLVENSIKYGKVNGSIIASIYNKEEKNYTGVIPEHEEGKVIDTVSTVELESNEAAKAFFATVKNRLLDVNRWHEIAGVMSASFQLVDERGHEVDRPVQKGDYLKIDIPGPGSTSGEGYDWVQVEELKIVSEDDVESVGIRVRPVASPVNENKDIAHFYSEESTSSFTVTREKHKITAGIYDRNTKPNTDAETLVGKVRDAVMGAGAVSVFSKLQWKSLADGLLKH